MPSGDERGSAATLSSAEFHRYPIVIEMAGPLAMFARPDTGGTPTSYVVPTWSAVKGIFESVAFFADAAAWTCPTRIEVCRKIGESGGRVTLQRYTNNYGGPLRKSNLMREGVTAGGSSMQVFANVLVDVCYRLHGVVVGPRRSGRVNARHHLQEMLRRRVRQGQCHRTPCLGWSEFTCSYWGPPRDEVTEVDANLNLDVPSMALGVWDGPVAGGYAPSFRQDVKIKAGVLNFLDYTLPPEWLATDGVSKGGV